MLLLLGGLTAAGRQDRSVVLGAKIGKRACTFYEPKNPVCIKILRTYAGIGDTETQSPGMLWKPGDLPQMCPTPKKFQRLATRDTLHGSRPNLRQREPDGRIVPTPPDVSDKGASTKRCARRGKKIAIKHIHIHILVKRTMRLHVFLCSSGGAAMLNRDVRARRQAPPRGTLRRSLGLRGGDCDGRRLHSTTKEEGD